MPLDLGSSTPPMTALGSSSCCDALGHESFEEVLGAGSCQEPFSVQGTGVGTVESSEWRSREGEGGEGDLMLIRRRTGKRRHNAAPMGFEVRTIRPQASSFRIWKYSRRSLWSDPSSSCVHFPLPRHQCYEWWNETTILNFKIPFQSLYSRPTAYINRDFTLDASAGLSRPNTSSSRTRELSGKGLYLFARDAMRDVRDAKRTAMLDRERNMCAGFWEGQEGEVYDGRGERGREGNREGGRCICCCKPSSKTCKEGHFAEDEEESGSSSIPDSRSSSELSSSEELSSVPSDESVSGSDFNTKLPSQGSSFKPSRPHRPGSRGLTT